MEKSNENANNGVELPPEMPQEIPPAEQIPDMADSPVTAEEMKAAVEALEQEDTTEGSLEEVRNNLENPPNPPEDNNGGGGGGDGAFSFSGRGEPISSPIGNSTEFHTQFGPCEACAGTGAKWFVFKCGACKGTGRVPISHSSRQKPVVIK